MSKDLRNSKGTDKNVVLPGVKSAHILSLIGQSVLVFRPLGVPFIGLPMLRFHSLSFISNNYNYSSNQSHISSQVKGSCSLCYMICVMSSCKHLTKTFGSKRPAIEYLSTVVYCSSSDISLSVSFHYEPLQHQVCCYLNQL